MISQREQNLLDVNKAKNFVRNFYMSRRKKSYNFGTKFLPTRSKPATNIETPKGLDSQTKVTKKKDVSSQAFFNLKLFSLPV